MRMRATIAVALLLAALVSTGLAQDDKSGPKPAPTARMVIEKLQYDFGEVKPGESLRHSFIIKNEGGADLKIVSVSPG